MKYIDKITDKVKCTDGMSPAKVYRCNIEEQTCFLKEIDEAFANTTYSVIREAQVMQWLDGKVNVPKVLEHGQKGNKEYLIMSEIKGEHIDSFAKEPLQYLENLVKAIQALHAVDISACPFVTDLDMRLEELDYLLKNNLADENPDHWQESTKFTSSQELYQWLLDNKPKEEFVFSHGDIGANFFVENDKIIFYDLARCGIADKWLDIAFCVRDIRDYYTDSEYEKLFFKMLGLEPDYEKIEYYILLDEMF